MIYTDQASATLSGDYSAVTVTTTGGEGFEYVWACAEGLVSDTVVATTASENANEWGKVR